MKSTNINSPVAGCMRWGVWGANFSTAQYRQMIESCLQYGISSFDHADIYGDYTTEAEFGDALKENPSLRQHLKLITKCGIQMLTPNRPEHSIKSYNTSKEHIIRSAERSLHPAHEVGPRSSGTVRSRGRSRSVSLLFREIRQFQVDGGELFAPTHLELHLRPRRVLLDGVLERLDGVNWFAVHVHQQVVGLKLRLVGG